MGLPVQFSACVIPFVLINQYSYVRRGCPSNTIINVFTQLSVLRQTHKGHFVRVTICVLFTLLYNILKLYLLHLGRL